MVYSNVMACFRLDNVTLFALSIRASPFPKAIILRDFRCHHATSSQRSTIQRCYATASSLGNSTKPSRKQVTVVNDDGRVQWKDLSRGEKAARTTQQTFNFGLVFAGFVGTVWTSTRCCMKKLTLFQGLVAYFLYTEVFASDSKTVVFNRAADRIRGDPRSLELLGSRKKIRAYGEPTGSKWSTHGHLASTASKDRAGAEHFKMHFNVEGSDRKGVVNLHMVKAPGQSNYEYRFLALDVPGHARHFLENADEKKSTTSKGFRMLGVQWK